MAGGQEITGEQGSFGQSAVVRLRSKKSGGGSASALLTGSSIAMSQGEFVKQRSKAIVGISATSSAGSVTAQTGTEPTWGVVPTISFTQGTSGTYNLIQHATNFNAATQDVVVSSGTLPTGVSLAATGVLTYNGTSPAASASGVIFEIRDKTTSADSDFAARNSGAVRSFNFDTIAQLGGGFGSNFGVIPGTGSVTIDTSIKASGAGSMRFDFVPGQGNSVNWFSNFTSDLSKRYGSNTEFYLQWKMRISQSVYEDWGHKYILIGTGDDGTNWYNSCTPLEIEMEPWANTRPVNAINQFPIMYNGCPGSCGASSVWAFQEPFGGSDFKLQNAIGSPFCRFSDSSKAQCVHVVPDQWMVFQIGVQVGTKISSGGHFWFAGSRIRAWMQQSVSSPEVLIHDWITGTTPGSAIGLCAGSAADERYGKVWLLPYTQNSVASPRGGSVWYDELIIKETKIAAAQA